MDKNDRTHARWPSDLRVEVFSGPVGGVRIGEGLLLDLSVTGCLLRVKGTLIKGGTYRVSLTWKEGALDLSGRVARDAGQSGTEPGARHYGIAFNLTGGQEKALMRLIDLLRLAKKPEDKGFMGGYWG
jgi:hypothetical protein